MGHPPGWSASEWQPATRGGSVLIKRSMRIKSAGQWGLGILAARGEVCSLSALCALSLHTGGLNPGLAAPAFMRGKRGKRSKLLFVTNDIAANRHLRPFPGLCVVAAAF
jgi:hypothetical protein